MRRPNRQPVIVLGATGMVGRRMAEMLVDHPFFEIAAVVGSDTSTGKLLSDIWGQKEAALAATYGPQVWKRRSFPATLRGLRVSTLEDAIRGTEARLAFSSLPTRAHQQEQRLLDAGLTVFSNSPWGRMDPANPLVVAEWNWVDMRDRRFIKSPNCVTNGLVVALAPIQRAFGLEAISVTTFQSLSGKGDRAYPESLVLRNVYPLHHSEEGTEETIKRELLAFFGNTVKASVASHRVATQEGHYVDVGLRLARRPPSMEALRAEICNFHPLDRVAVPLCRERPLLLVDEPGRPRPADDAEHGGGMTVAVGNLRTDDELFDIRMSVVVNNLVRGAAGGAIQNAELFVAAIEDRVPRVAAGGG